AHFSITTTTSTMAGVAFDITVTALDGSGNVITGYTGTVHFTSSDGSALLPGDYTFTSADNGSHTFLVSAGSGVTLYKAGSQTVTATDLGNGTITGKATVNVSAAAASKLVFGQQPTNTSVGGTISPAVTVLVEDVYGNLVTSDNSDQVNLTV